MKRIRALGSVLVALVAVTAAALALAPSKGEAQDTSRAVAGGTLRTLAPSQIIMEVRRAGFKPISRPVQRGPVYVVSALDGDQFDVNLTLDAYSGRLLWVADIGRTRFGSYYGYPAWPYRARPLVPPADIANSGPDMNIRPDRTAVRSSPPLPRARPVELTSAVNTQSATPPAQDPPDVAAAAKPPPVAPTMVPIAPLE
jgi:hypothetical protein